MADRACDRIGMASTSERRNRNTELNSSSGSGKSVFAILWKARERSTRPIRSGRCARTPTTMSAPVLAARKRESSRMSICPSAGTRKTQSPRASRSAVVIAPEKPRFAPWCTTRTRASRAASASTMVDVPSVLPSSTSSSSPSLPVADSAASASAATVATLGASSNAGMAMVMSTAGVYVCASRGSATLLG